MKGIVKGPSGNILRRMPAFSRHLSCKFHTLEAPDNSFDIGNSGARKAIANVHSPRSENAEFASGL